MTARATGRPREQLDEVRDRGLRRHRLVHREDRDDADVHEDVEDGDREDRHDDDARDRLRRLDDLLGEVADVVVAEVVVDREDERGPEAAEDAGRRDARRGDDGRLPEAPAPPASCAGGPATITMPSVARTPIQRTIENFPIAPMRRMRSSVDGDAEERRRRRLPAVRDPGKDEARGTARSRSRPTPSRAEPRRRSGRGRGTRRAVPSARVRTPRAGTRTSRPPRGSDAESSAVTRPSRDREERAQDPREERPPAAHRGEDEGKRHERTDPHHVDDVQGGPLPEPDLPAQPSRGPHRSRHPRTLPDAPATRNLARIALVAGSSAEKTDAQTRFRTSFAIVLSCMKDVPS